VLLAIVADGHGGKQASVHCHATLLDNFVQAAGGFADASAKTFRGAARAVFATAHQEILDMQPPTTAGTTLTILAVNPKRREITCAHVGDSVAMLVPRDGSAPTELCEDHRIDTSDIERARLIAAGGTIAPATDSNGQPGGPLRLWPGGVAQARSIGDSDINDFNDPRPHTCSYPFPPDGCGDVVVCSDGVWDALNHSEVAGLLRKSFHCTASVAARLIVKTSLHQRHAYDNNEVQIPRDDTSCIVLRIGEMDGASEVFVGPGCLC